MADERIEIEELPPTSTQARTDMIPSQKAGGGTVFLTIAQILGLINSTDVSASLVAATSDNTIADGDELLYLSATTVKKGLFSGFITSLFNGTRKIANGFFEADTLRFYKAATAFYAWLDASGLTAARKITLPDRDVTLGMVRLSTGTVPGAAAVDFAVPAGVRRLVLALAAFSTNGTSVPIIQLKTGGAADTTGYAGTAVTLTSASTTTSNISAGFSLSGNVAAATVYHVLIEIVLQDNNLWVAAIKGALSNTAGLALGAGSKTLAGVLDGIRLTTVGGTEVPDAGVYTLYAEY
ncbi:hypothetical protein [Rhizobium sp. MHM7A]|uniref:hypothetical protein n=1 Tax=Rhizobium sp. MHM7A TaxID=2583233 RepID=UPI001486A68F|nr:hypothetical protein [Rhizobium sp. MHM7A]